MGPGQGPPAQLGVVDEAAGAEAAESTVPFMSRSWRT